MPRHAALIPLSHDHHHALVLALRLKKGGPASQNDRGWPTDISGQLQSTLEFAKDELLPHFLIEEEILYPAAREQRSESLDLLIGQLLEDHTSMRAVLHDLKSTQAPESEILGQLQQFGAQLGKHIRREERELFPLIEQLVPPSQLQGLSDAIVAAHLPGSHFRNCAL